MKYDVIEKPKHYNQGKYETIDIIKDTLGDGFKYYLKGNILKYIIREQYKGKTEDLKKARWYLDRLINESGLNDTNENTTERYEEVKDNVLWETINNEIENTLSKDELLPNELKREGDLSLEIQKVSEEYYWLNINKHDDNSRYSIAGFDYDKEYDLYRLNSVVDRLNDYINWTDFGELVEYGYKLLSELTPKEIYENILESKIQDGVYGDKHIWEQLNKIVNGE